ncbi:MAG: MG2 domain-containing protein [Thermoproteota archaeon]
MRFDNQTLFRSAAPFGHKLAVVSSYFGNEASIGVGNPSGYEFKNCSVILEAASGGITNTTLKTYGRILPHTYDFFKVQLGSSTNARDLLVLECKDPYELATSPAVFIGKHDYRPGENVTIKGMIGYSQVTVRVLDADGNASLEKKVATNDGFLKFIYQIPDNAKLGTWSVRVESSNVILGQDFRVLESNR